MRLFVPSKVTYAHVCLFLTVLLLLSAMSVFASPLLVQAAESSINVSATNDYFLHSLETTSTHDGANWAVEGSTTVTLRGVLTFNISSIPDGATITSATFGAYHSSDDIGTTAGRTYIAYRVVRTDTDETGTWVVYKTGSSWTTAGCGSTATDYTTTNNASATVSVVGNWTTWTVTDMTADAYAASDILAIRVSDSVEGSGTRYNSQWHDHENTNDPYLYVAYTYSAAPTVNTSAATGVGSTAATLNGNITDEGDEDVTTRGFEWGLSTGTYTEGDWHEDGSFSTGTFGHTEEGLNSDTTYYYRAYATSSEGTAYGSEVIFATTPLAGPGDWLSGYTYRQKFTVEGGTSPLYDYAVSFRLYEDSPQDSYQAFLDSLPFSRRAGPFLQPSGVSGSYDADGLEYNFVMENPYNPNQLLMYYAPGSLTAAKWEYAAVATSTKGTDVWTKYSGNPIVTATGPGLRSSSPVYYGGTFYLYYSDESPVTGAYLATSTDGFTFTKYGGGATPVLAGAGTPFVTRFGTTWYMYYGTGSPRSIRVATSSNGINWVDVGAILTTTGDTNRPWFEEAKTVYQIGGTYILLYDVFGDNNYPAEMWLATSSSATGTFTPWSGNPIWAKNPASGAWDDAAVTTSALFWNASASRWDMYYCGTSNNADWLTFRPTGYGVAQSTVVAPSQGKTFLYGHALNWPNDIRFTKADGTTLLAYELSATGGSADIQVQFDSIPTSGTTGYIYYGKDGGSSGSSELSPSVVFSDTFNRADNDTIGGTWAEQGETDGDISTNRLRVYSNTTVQTTNHVRHPVTLTSDTTISWDAVAPDLSLSGSGKAYSFFLLDGNPGSTGAWGIEFLRTAVYGLRNICIQDAVSGDDWPTIVGTWTPGASYHFELRYDYSEGTISFYVNSAYVAAQAGASIAAWNAYASHFVIAGSGNAGVYLYVDNVLVTGLEEADVDIVGWLAEETSGAPTITTSTAAGVSAAGATLQGSIDDLGDATTVYAYFQYGKTTAYEQGATAEQTVTAVGGYSQVLTGLDANTVYYFRAATRYSSAYAYGGQASFTTTGGSTPGAPTNFNAQSTSAQIDLSWIKGTGATRTMIRYSTAGHPTSVLDGEQVYFGVDESVTLTAVTVGLTYYFSAWSESGGQYSLTYARTAGMLGTSGTLPLPTAFQIESVKVFASYLESGDMLFVLSNEVIMDDIPGEDIKDCVKIQVLDVSTVKAQSVPTQWGYRPASVYLSASDALVWGAEYTMRLAGRDGKWTSTPSTDLTLAAGSWVSGDSDHYYLKDWILNAAERMGEYYSLALVTYSPDRGRVLTTTGGDWFSQAIPGLRNEIPTLFASSATDIDAYSAGELGYEGATSMEVAWGEYIAEQFAAFGGSMGLSGNWAGAVPWLLMLLLVTGLFAAVPNIGPELAVVLVVPLGCFAGSYLRVLDFTAISAVGVLLIVLAAFKYLIIKGGAG